MKVDSILITAVVLIGLAWFLIPPFLVTCLTAFVFGDPNPELWVFLVSLGAWTPFAIRGVLRW